MCASVTLVLSNRELPFLDDFLCNSDFLGVEASMFDVRFKLSDPCPPIKVKFLCHDRLGFFGFTNHILKDSMKDGFIEELELDMRGHIDVTNFRVTREIAEIKSGGNILRKATLQLVKRLGVLYLAGKYCLPENLESKYNFESIGRLYSAGKCESPDQSLIDSCKEEAGLVDYPHIHIFMQRL